MANTKISALPLGNPAQSTDALPVARAGQNFKVTASSIAALAPVQSVAGRTGAVVLSESDVGGLVADLAAKANAAQLATVATSGEYSDLKDKPIIPAAQVNSDWNAISGVAQIINKPTIPAAQVNSDWNASSGPAQILNKPFIPTLPISEANVANLTGDLAARLLISDFNTYQAAIAAALALKCDTSRLAAVAFSGSYSDLSNKPVLATVATTGSYTDLLNKPTIPTLPTFVDDETPTGAINGTNAVFTLAHTPTGLQLYKNGVRLRPNLDYSVSANAITYASSQIPSGDDTHACTYRY